MYINVGYRSKCFESTPKILQNIDPSKGLPTLLLKLNVPVNIAKTVASILIGVIFANKTIVGSILNANEVVSEKILTKITKERSSIPNFKLSLNTKASENNAPMRPKSELN